MPMWPVANWQGSRRSEDAEICLPGSKVGRLGCAAARSHHRGQHHPDCTSSVSPSWSARASWPERSSVRWNAAGLPSYIGYGKNIERAAIDLTVASVAIFMVFFARREKLSFSFIAWIVTVVAVLKVYYASRWAKVVLLLLLVANCIYVTWYNALRDQARPTSERCPPRWHLYASVFILIPTACWLFVAACKPGEIDLFHQGEVLTSCAEPPARRRPVSRLLLAARSFRYRPCGVDHLMDREPLGSGR